MEKNVFWGQKPSFLAQKERLLLYSNHALATTGKSCAKKVTFSQISISLLPDLGSFFLEKNGHKPKVANNLDEYSTDFLFCPPILK